ncbi:ergosterol biosynthesis ERG4/ERG24 [Dichotomocladium elegans]|nr:ergosterol biosynthesis ERG4/ERG24 [Dichotomocladium elegans]
MANRKTNAKTRTPSTHQMRPQNQNNSRRITNEKNQSNNNNSSNEHRQALSQVDWQRVNPKTEHYEFGGPFGAFAMITLLPIVVLAFALGCDSEGYDPFQRTYGFLNDLLAGKFSRDVLLAMVTSVNPYAFLWYILFVCQLTAFAIWLPGDCLDGTKLRDGSRLKYKLNGLQSAQTLFMIGMMANRGQGYRMPMWVYNNFADLAVASVIFAFLVSIGVYVGSFNDKRRLLSLGGNTGNPIYDFMVGRELNPRIGSFDIKFFTELRPGLLGWMFINICMGIKQYADLLRVTNSMVLVCAFQAIYVLDALYNEASILTTMDITTDGFGFMLAFGNYSWVPMMYSLQARYLADHPVDLSITAVFAIVALQATGYYLFRSSNSQKDIFRREPNDPRVQSLEYIETSTGSRLLISGWWGKARHINYFGDWLMSVAWCLPCGFDSIVPYFYCIYFAILLIHRERRDDEKCRRKYGADWDRYCSAVKYRIIPYIY